MTPDEMYTFAIRYEGQQEPDGEWIEMVAIQANLAQAQAVWDEISPYLADMPNVRDAGIVYTPKIVWQPYQG
ncbi:hypothetical protein KIP30_gp06 [Mycobacterium phage Pistachio]|uniref:Uncharacterized protein n=1 Tax=Mycobacterium phage Pistachio TaxID=2126722 RepID=A0A2R4A289_9CAUD|nr:hypothetical protein KIP30_gp06 [Mycobacterium phage Pistachio]AQT28408.1 hypothetical protein SEA_IDLEANDCOVERT_5 [Mycobacterium phage Idleandcovert]AVR56992.1 hypothetical protein PBI_PUPPY_6 [Mycobacterium phage Puppy]AVR57081.1 hypothetical protein PBI_PISTACHIO_6 [Mycobacterium phage Pistachio]WAB10194.1 hypothetical protein PBI_BLUEBIRD_6 [Mycobacterium phage BlueBird]